MGLNDNLQYSKQGLTLTEDFELAAAHFPMMPYKDQGGVWTDGYGNTHNVHPGVPVTQAQAVAQLQLNVRTAENAVRRLAIVRLNQGEFDGMVDFTFNVGEGNLEKSTLLKLVNAGHPDGATLEFLKWENIHGTPNKGLARRRVAESKLFETGVLQLAA